MSSNVSSARSRGSVSTRNPDRNPALGGLSSSTQQLLTSMLAKSGMSRRKQNELLARMEQSPCGSLPIELGKGNRSAQGRPAATAPVVYRMQPGGHRPGKRQLADIMSSNAFAEPEPFRPSPTRDRTQEIARLQAKMSGSKEEGGPKQRKDRRPADDADQELDPMRSLLSEIEERSTWLKEMEELGQAEPHRAKIQTEINVRISQMEQLAKRLNREEGEEANPA